MIYTLRITSWIEVDEHARHYYGRIQPGHVDLEHEVQADDEDYCSSYTASRATPGETKWTSRFIKKEQVIAAAHLWMKNNAKEDDTLEINDTVEVDYD